MNDQSKPEVENDGQKREELMQALQQQDKQNVAEGEREIQELLEKRGLVLDSVCLLTSQGISFQVNIRPKRQ